MRRVPLVALLACGGLIAGCGGGDDPVTPTGSGQQEEGQAATSDQLRAELQEATAPTAADFEPVGGRSLQQIADSLTGAGTQVGLATSVFVPGEQRLAFGVIDEQTGFVYGKTAVYISRSPADVAQGPFPAPADLLITDPAYSSDHAADEDDLFAAVYAAKVPLKETGAHSMLVVTLLDDGRTIGAGSTFKVIAPAKDTVVGVGEAAPKTDTDTLDSAGGDIEAIETRQPPDSMHKTNLADVLGKKPVALLFATPQLCESRVCGPVVDIAEQLKQTYGDRVEFIHQEVFVGNDHGKGLRQPLRAFGLQTEPWLFVIGTDGRVKARLEGSFGFDAFKAALESAV